MYGSTLVGSHHVPPAPGFGNLASLDHAIESGPDRIQTDPCCSGNFLPRQGVTSCQCVQDSSLGIGTLDFRGRTKDLPATSLPVEPRGELYCFHVAATDVEDEVAVGGTLDNEDSVRRA